MSENFLTFLEISKNSMEIFSYWKNIKNPNFQLQFRDSLSEFLMAKVDKSYNNRATKTKGILPVHPAATAKKIYNTRCSHRYNNWIAIMLSMQSVYISTITFVQYVLLINKVYFYWNSAFYFMNENLKTVM